MFRDLIVSKVERLTDDSVAISFRVPEQWRADFTFEAGQFLTVRRDIDGQEQRRSYSICATSDQPPRIGVRSVAGGALSTWLTGQVRVGDLISIDSPSGRFHTGGITGPTTGPTTGPITGGRHLLVAAGSGITPMIGIARSLLTTGAQVILIYANRRTSTVMFVDELADLKDEFLDRFELVHVLSREPRDVDLFSGRLDRDRLTTILEQLVSPETRRIDHVWLCGPFALITECADLLRPRVGEVHLELFYVEEVPPELATHVDLPPSGQTSTVTVVLDGKSTTAALPTDQSILEAAQQVRADLPFACKGGVCGTCRARVTAGKVDMRRNYALEEAEVDAGFVLTCQSFPISDDVTIDFDA